MRTPEDLSHVIRKLPHGGAVIVLDTGALLKAEAQAMVGAQFSRSVLGVVALVERMFNRDVGKFMRENYVAGYGHKSIGELGDAAIFIEGVSMLAAKAIQDFPLYRGQESSTRYIDFSKQALLNPLGSKYGVEVLEKWRAFYLRAYEFMVPHLIRQFPRQPGEDEKTYEKAIKARAFDTCRAFLPAGATTNVAWMGDLRHMNDHLAQLRNHPLEEVRTIGLVAEDALMEKFPDSFSLKRYGDTEEYLRETLLQHNYREWFDQPEFRLTRDSLDYPQLREYEWVLNHRPPKIELPWAIRECGTMQFDFTLDFGSFRDLQRQRALITRMPLLGAGMGFAPWYLDEVPEPIRQEAVAMSDAQLKRLRMLGHEFTAQYYHPMGFQTPIRMTGDLRALTYFVELRATRFVHPTLRKRAIQTAEVLTKKVRSYGLRLHLDQDPDRFDVKRGEHDITEKV